MKKLNQLQRLQVAVEKVTFVVMPRYGTPSMESLSKIPVDKRTFVAKSRFNRGRLWDNVIKAQEKANKLSDNHPGSWVKRTVKKKEIIHSV